MTRSVRALCACQKEEENENAELIRVESATFTLLIVLLLPWTYAYGRPSGAHSIVTTEFGVLCDASTKTYSATASQCAAADASPDDHHRRDDVIWRSSRVCGVNCLYLLMRCYGLKPDYVEMRDELLKERLMSLADLREFALSKGFGIRLVRFTPAELREIGAPVIAHFDSVGIDGVGRGHFVLVTEATDGFVRCTDGTSMIPKRFSWETFQRKWSGYVAHAARPPQHGKITLSVLIALVAGAASGWLIDRMQN